MVLNHQIGVRFPVPLPSRLVAHRAEQQPAPPGVPVNQYARPSGTTRRGRSITGSSSAPAPPAVTICRSSCTRQRLRGWSAHAARCDSTAALRHRCSEGVAVGPFPNSILSGAIPRRTGTQRRQHVADPPELRHSRNSFEDRTSRSRSPSLRVGVRRLPRMAPHPALGRCQRRDPDRACQPAGTVARPRRDRFS